MLNITLASLLTPAGMVGGAALITALVQIVKTLLPGVVARSLEVRIACLFSALLVGAAYLSQGTSAFYPDAAFGAFLAWVGTAMVSMGIYDGTSSLRSADPKAPKTPISPPIAGGF